MDPINTQSSFHAYRNTISNPTVAAKPSAENTAAPKASDDFSSLFDDDALLRLQENLEAIAQMAESALNSIER